ncbi:hypothetical protein GA0061099_100366 [Bradyrhizobium yuanmingense]|uniref:Uncharacterized protein n=1 Tax=Bradyrhizobium yuanmingense TaxID=108015 RepID=A0A1C3V2M0_9BRAD|nr:hypothetical protein [Bradyrhizobium yuanmingense]TWI26585.1 hypothetical protein IQ15_04020 [Bradyrhizobium yuanmingense]SCB21898.1 hypothetical protein GA0061099_100366 [Bradyrhizobium yuanmingense]
MAPYVELDRQFVDYDEDDEAENESTSFVDLYSSKSWDQILQARCTVVMAEAGTGKSEEFRQQARRLIAEGKPAFYAALDLLAKLPSLQSALNIGTAEDLLTWQRGEEHAYFFLDAVDEAKLADPRDFTIAITQFADAVGPNNTRYSLVVSTRPHAWQANADRAMLAERLGLQSVTDVAEEAKDPARTTDGGEEDGVSDDDGLDGSATSGTEKSPPVNVVRLAGLSTEQVSKFAAANGVDRPEAFIAAVEHANAEVFATRPADLPGLIALWKRDGRIGNYSDVVRYNVEIKLSELNPAYKGRGIALEHAVLGAQALAAAATLSERTSFLLPDEGTAERVRSNSIDPGTVLQGWKAEEINALLSTALFDESLYGTVRFHHPTAREYLCACWLARLLDRRKNRRKVEALLFARPYGTEHTVVRPAIKPIAAWLALTDQDIRDQVLNADPKVLLENGDASALDIGTRGTLLKVFAERYQDRNHTPIRIDTREVRRFADQRLSSSIRALFDRYREHLDVRQLLLRIVREAAIPGFQSIAFDYFKERTADSWTKALSVQVIAATGSVADKRKLARLILRDPAGIARDLVGHALEFLVPEYISYVDLVDLLRKLPANAAYDSDLVNHELETILANIPHQQEKLDILEGLNALLTTPPLHDDEFTRISTRYDWLLPSAGALAFDIIGGGDGYFSNPALLSVLSMCLEAGHISRYTDNVEEKASKIVGETPKLKHELFWHEVRRMRRRGQGPVIEWRQVSPFQLLGVLNLRDFEFFTAVIRDCRSLDDKRTAVSAAFAAWHHSGRPEEKLEELKAAVASSESLSSELELLISPSLPDEATRRSMAQLAARRQRSDQERERRSRDRQEWIERLKGNPSQVGDLSIAHEGKVWNNTRWLFDEARKAEKKNTAWTMTKWQGLIPEFGEEVAVKFRDFCRGFWRQYRPPIRSSYKGAAHSTPWNVIIGLSGIAMEADGSAGWVESLSGGEAEVAARYGTWELNSFPRWFEDLRNAYPATVDRLLLDEAKWELTTPAESSRGYILSRLRRNGQLGGELSGKIATLVRDHPHGTQYAVREAITIVMADERRPPDSFLEITRVRASIDSPLRALWIAALLALDGSSGLKSLRIWVKGGSDDSERAARANAVLHELFDEDRRGIASAHKDFVTVPILHEMLGYLHLAQLIETEDEDEEGEAHYRSLSYRQRHGRDLLLELLFNLPGRETYDALIALADNIKERRDYFLVLAERRAEQDSDAGPWAPSDVHAFAADVERAPRTEDDLFRIALSRLDDLKHEYEEGDESEASLLRKVSNEVELRKVIANRLKLAARSSYTTGSEEELADGKRTDIRLHHPAVERRIPIEIKIAGQWQAHELNERLKNQLIGQYMREARHGIFLLVNRGGTNDCKRWRVNNRLVGLQELESWLRGQAKAYQRTNGRVSGLEIVSFDLLKLGSSKLSLKPAKKAGKPKKSAKRSARRQPR